MKGRIYIFKALFALMTALYVFSIFPGVCAFAQGTSYEKDEISGIFNDNTEDEERQVSSRFLELFLSKAESAEPEAYSGLKYYVGGEAFGVRLSGVGVKVVGTAREEGGPLKADDRIIKINGYPIETVDQVRQIIASHGGEKLLLEIEREGKRSSLSVKPSYNGKEYNLGAILTDCAQGIGTLTYVVDDGSFGGLGHGISDGGEGGVFSMKSGTLTGIILAGTKQSECGKPGELRGVLTDQTVGTVIRNTDCGIFGIMSEEYANELCTGAPIELATRGEVHTGDAKIVCTVKGSEKREYSIRIERIDRHATGSKCFRIKVTDNELLALTGGIVRGMSGSPIIQDGKLVGAVTHVMVADPTEGYGIFIENMLEAARQGIQPKAA